MSLPLLAELQGRCAFRALVGYGIAAFAVLQIIEPIMHELHWPDSVLSYVVVALALGFPLVEDLRLNCRRSRADGARSGWSTLNRAY